MILVRPYKCVLYTVDCYRAGTSGMVLCRPPVVRALADVILTAAGGALNYASTVRLVQHRCVWKSLGRAVLNRAVAERELILAIDKKRRPSAKRARDADAVAIDDGLDIDLELLLERQLDEAGYTDEVEFTVDAKEDGEDAPAAE